MADVGSFECDHTLCTGWTCTVPLVAPVDLPIEARKMVGKMSVDPDNVIDPKAIHTLWKTLVDSSAWAGGPPPPVDDMPTRIDIVGNIARQAAQDMATKLDALFVALPPGQRMCVHRGYVQSESPGFNRDDYVIKFVRKVHVLDGGECTSSQVEAQYGPRET